MVSIRIADDADNAELLDLEKMCPQGTSLVLQFDRSPDFFLRSRVYDNYKVYVAEEEGKIVGTVGATLKEISMNEESVKGVYIYDLRVHPAFRGRGIGSKLAQQVIAEEDKAGLAYGIIVEDNYPSVALFKRSGFQNIHNLILLNVPLYKRQEKISGKIREMTVDDAPSVVNLINDHCRNHDLFAPLSVNNFLEKTRRLTDYGFQGVQVAEAENQIVACAGLWDYSRILRTSVLRVTARLKMLTYVLRFANLFTNTMKLPSVGESFRLMYVTDFAFTGEVSPVRELIKHCISLSYSRGCNFLVFPLDPLNPAIPLIEKYRPVRISYHIYAKSLREKTLSTQRMIFVDAMDL
ncbi:MAG TPA: GNAT family N-acetyltransferase [Acidobacteriota bacterium]|nr:GNAT family N-acetyltransferase [Acidobacteriota bacterium]